MTITNAAHRADDDATAGTDHAYLQSRWDEATASQLDAVGRLIYRSNLLGSDARITNTGGGNTSAKIDEADPLTGEPVRVLWVKGSGGDLRTDDVTSRQPI